MTVDGPVRRVQTKRDQPTATPVVIEFGGIPVGTYRVTAQYGSKKITRSIQVGSGETLEFDLLIP